MIERPLGAGGFGVVYQAFDSKRNARVALKTLSQADPVRLYHLKQEFRSLAGIVHPNLATLYELLTAGDQSLFTMELIEGRDFLEHVRGESAPESRSDLPTMSIEAGPRHDAASLQALRPAPAVPLDYNRLRDALRQLIEGLAALHRYGKLHRDIKPSNVMVEDGGRVVLLDFGLAADKEFGGKTVLSGTLHYMAPELASGKQSEASDWYSVGVMLHQCLTGQYPEAAGRPLLETEPDIPPDLRDLCRRLLDSDPARRPGDADLLAAFCGSAPGQAEPGRFVGRAAELTALWDAYEATSTGKVVAVRLSGSSGIGKSALVREFRRALSRREPGAVQLFTRCFDRESVRYKALDGVVDGLCRLLAGLPPGEVERYLPRDIAALSRVFPVLGRVPAVNAARRRTADPEDAQELRRRAFAALREMFARLAAVQPVAVFIDDLQWSDPDSVPAMQALLREPDAPAILIVAAYRAEEAGNAVMRELVPVLEAAGGREIPLGMLSDADARSLALALGSGARAEAAVREAGGNPFLIDALLRYEDEPGSAAPTLERVIERQVARLPEAGRLVVELLATAFGPLSPDMLPEEADPRVLSLLAAERLIHSRGAGDEIEPYHDRIRETVAMQIPPGRARQHHLRLARAFAGRDPAEPEAAALHFRGAGDPVSAAPYAEIAGERAMQALAFNQAALLFEIALEHPSLSDGERRRLRRRLGDALTDAGRARGAAAAYRSAAQGAPPAERIELLRLAGDRLLVGGDFDEGYDTMRQVLETVGMTFPATPRAALWSVIWRRTYLALRGFRYRVRPEEAVDPRRLLRIDACASLVGGFAPIDPIRAMDFQARLLVYALREGEPVRLARAFASDVGVITAGGVRASADRAIRRAQAATALTGDPAAVYLLASNAALAAFFQGRWEETLNRFSAAMQMQPPAGAGASWVIASRKLCMLVSWVYAGDIPSASEHLPGMVADARGRGDLHAETSLRCRCTAMPLLAAGKPEQVRPEVEGAVAGWSQKGYHLQHFWALLSLVETDLYAGDPHSAWKRIQTDWPELKGGLVTKIQLIQIESHHLRARAALALAAKEGAGRLRGLALRDTATLEREKAPWSEGLALLLRAAGARLGGGDATSLLERAETALRSSGMRLYAAAAARRLALLRGDSAGVNAADAFMRHQGVADPARMTDVLAPGFEGG